MRVLVTGVGGGVGQAVVSALRSSTLAPEIIGVDANPSAAGLFLCDQRAVVPLAAAEADYIASLAEIVRQRRVDVVVPGSDPELVPLARHRENIERSGCRVVVSDAELVKVCRNKLETARVLTAAGCPFARSCSPGDMRLPGAGPAYPVMAKPVEGSGSAGWAVLFSEEDHRALPEGVEYVVLEYLVPARWGKAVIDRRDVMTGGRLRQRDEISVQAVVSLAGEILGMFASTNELQDGVVMTVRPTEDPEILRTAAGVFETLCRLGLRGPCNLQGRQTARGTIFYEVNPRFTGITGVRASMGFNECEAALRLFGLGEPAAAVAGSLTRTSSTMALRFMTEILVDADLITT